MSKDDKTEERLRVLEEKFEYQDNTIEVLNQVIIDMQAEIDQLRENFSDLKKVMATVDQNNGETSDPPPPHY